MRSLDLNWLSRRDKQLSLPDVVYGDFAESQGCYAEPSWYGKEYCGIIMSGRNGTIVVNPRTAVSVASVIAHEWRHHWQYWRGLLGFSKWKLSGAGYWSDIYDYFQIPHERDALRFEFQMAPTDLSAEWIACLQNKPKSET